MGSCSGWAWPVAAGVVDTPTPTGSGVSGIDFVGVSVGRSIILGKLMSTWSEAS